MQFNLFSIAQITRGRTTNSNQRVTTPINLRVAKDSLKVFGIENRNYNISTTQLKEISIVTASKYSVYKSGLEIPANQLSSHDESSLYAVTVNGSWSVSSSAIALEPGRGIINYELKPENGKNILSN